MNSCSPGMQTRMRDHAGIQCSWVLPSTIFCSTPWNPGKTSTIAVTNKPAANSGDGTAAAKSPCLSGRSRKETLHAANKNMLMDQWMLMDHQKTQTKNGVILNPKALRFDSVLTPWPSLADSLYHWVYHNTLHLRRR